jgi:hypothetical protein
MVGRLQYFIRAGSDFVPTPHMVLAGMFGRAAPPNVIHNYVVAPAKLHGDSISCQLGLLLRNLGPGIASDLYATIKCWQSPGSPSSLEFETPDRVNWTGSFAFGRFCSLISQAGFRVPPEGQTNPLVLTLTITAPIDDGIRISGVVGAGNSAPHRIALCSTLAQLVSLYEEIISLRRSGHSVDEKLLEFPASAFGVGEAANGEGA